MLRTLGLMHLVGHQLTAIDVLDHVPVEEAALGGCGQPSDIPAPHLVRAVRPMRG